MLALSNAPTTAKEDQISWRYKFSSADITGRRQSLEPKNLLGVDHSARREHRLQRPPHPRRSRLERAQVRDKEERAQSEAQWKTIYTYTILYGEKNFLYTHVNKQAQRDKCLWQTTKYARSAHLALRLRLLRVMRLQKFDRCTVANVRTVQSEVTAHVHNTYVLEVFCDKIIL